MQFPSTCLSVAAFAASLSFLSAAPAQAVPVVLGAHATAIYGGGGSNLTATGPNFSGIIGNTINIDPVRNPRNTAVLFDLSGLAGDATSVVLRVPLSIYNSTDASETILVYDVVMPIADVMEEHQPPLGSYDAEGIAIFNDLADGVLFGTRTVTAANLSSEIHITLASSAVAAVNAAAGGIIAFGLHLEDNSPPRDDTESLILNEFWDTDEDWGLIIDNAPIAAPAPATAFVLLFGLAAVIGLNRRSQG